MYRLLLPFLAALLSFASPAGAAVEIAYGDQPPVTIQEVYLRDGTVYLPADELLSVFGLSGQWVSTEHVYRVSTPRGTAVLAPGSRLVRLGPRSTKLAAPPLFIDQRLRLPEEFVHDFLADILDGGPIGWRNLDPAAAPKPEQDAIGKLISLLLRKDEERPGPPLRAVLIDPGHGGADPGSIGPAGITEKAVVLEVGRRLEKRLKMRLDVPVHLSRDGDYTLAPAQRLEAAGRTDIDAIVLLHAQSALSPAVSGINLIVRPQEEGADGAPESGEGSLRLARHLAEELRQAGLTVRGILRAPLQPLGRGNLPTVLVELGYLTNEEDRNLLREVAGQDRLAEALFAGLRKFAEEKRKEQDDGE